MTSRDPVPLSEAARQLGVSPETLRWQVHNGKLEARKIGTLWVVDQDEIERYRQESRRESPGR